MAVLARAHIFRGLPEEDLELLGFVARRRSFNRREALYRTGDPGDRLHVIEHGYVKIVLETHTGDQQIIDVRGPGDWFGELALVDRAPRRAMVRALGPVTTVSVPCETVMELLYSHRELVDRALEAYRQRIRFIIDLLADLTFLSVRERTARRLLNLGARFGCREGDAIKLDVPLVQADLAALVGATRTSVNAALRQFEQQGVISLRKRQFMIRRLNQLERIAGMPRSSRTPRARGSAF